MTSVKRVILDYAAGELILQVKAAHAAIRDGRPIDGISVLAYGLGGGPGKVFAVKWNKGSVRVYPQQKVSP